jgi:hypothetical protein
MKVQFYCYRNEQAVRTVSLYGIQFLHKRQVLNCTIFLGLGVKNLHYYKGYLAT